MDLHSVHHFAFVCFMQFFFFFTFFVRARKRIMTVQNNFSPRLVTVQGAELRSTLIKHTQFTHKHPES